MILSRDNSLLTPSELSNRANKFRLKILEMAVRGGGGHIGGAYSIIDILTALYFNILKHNPNDPSWEERDRLVFSKGHCCLALYNILADFGYFPEEWLETYYQDGGKLAGHPTYRRIPGVEATGGSLGHGLSISIGMALAAKLKNKKWRVFSILGDGECNEGSVWEAFAAGAQFGLDNLTMIIDCNGYESLGTVDEIMSIEPLVQRLVAFGWVVEEIDGHNMELILDTLNKNSYTSNKPRAIITRTKKGKGVSFMENVSKWHYRAPDKEEEVQARVEIEALLAK